MRLLNQALILICVCGLSSCARILGAIFAPQESVASAAGQAAQGATRASPVQDTTRMSSELNRLLADKGLSNHSDVQALQDEIDRSNRIQRGNRSGSAQEETERRETWDPRVVRPPFRSDQAPDVFQLGPPPGPAPVARGGPDRPRPVPDGIGPGASARMYDFSQVRILDR